jgi:acyl-CoA thioester hydrolase
MHTGQSRLLFALPGGARAARNELFRKLGVPLFQWQQQQLIFPVIECRLRYKGAARYDDLLRVETWITMAAGVRLNFAYRLVNQMDQLILEAETWHVCTTLTEKPRRLPEELLIAAELFLGKTEVA